MQGKVDFVNHFKNRILSKMHDLNRGTIRIKIFPVEFDHFQRRIELINATPVFSEQI